MNVNPVIKPDPDAEFLCPMRQMPVHWEALHTFNPAATVHDGKVFLLYRAEDDSGIMQIGMHTSRLGLGISEDGLNFARQAAPVLYPAEDKQKRYEWSGGCEDPRLIAGDDGNYVLTYTQWDRNTPRLAIATTSDFVHWQKHGPAFAKAYGGTLFEHLVQIRRDRWTGAGRPNDRGEDQRQILDVLGRRRRSSRHLFGLD